MDYRKLTEDVKKLKLETIRTDSPDLLEFVLAKESIPHLEKTLAAFFGPPLKPSDLRTSKKLRDHVSPHGGIRAGQSLYFSEGEELLYFAMIWPWSDGALATVKIISEEKSETGPSSQSLLGRIFGPLFGRKG